MNEQLHAIQSANYYAGVLRPRDALEYRLDAAEVVKSVVDQLRGGMEKDDDGEEHHREAYRLMNELGISKVEMFLSGFVNKVVHLTKYKNEDRVLLQVREAALAFNFDMTKNMKLWGPEFTTTLPDGETLEAFAVKRSAIRVKLLADGKVRYQLKVRNKRLILQLVENALLASMQRGEEGFEAGNTVKQITVVESKGGEQQQAYPTPSGNGIFGFLRGR